MPLQQDKHRILQRLHRNPVRAAAPARLMPGTDIITIPLPIHRRHLPHHRGPAVPAHGNPGQQIHALPVRRRPRIHPPHFRNQGHHHIPGQLPDIPILLKIRNPPVLVLIPFQDSPDLPLRLPCRLLRLLPPGLIRGMELHIILLRDHPVLHVLIKHHTQLPAPLRLA